MTSNRRLPRIRRTRAWRRVPRQGTSIPPIRTCPKAGPGKQSAIASQALQLPFGRINRPYGRGRCSRGFNVPVADFAPPCPGLRGSSFDEIAEPIEISLGPPVDDAERIPRLLHQVIRLDIEGKIHPGRFRTQRFESDPTVVTGSFRAHPGDRTIWF